MPKLKVLSGRQVVKILSRFGFKAVSQRGSHVKLRGILQLLAEKATGFSHVDNQR